MGKNIGTLKVINHDTKLEEDSVHTASKKQRPVVANICFIELDRENRLRLDDLLKIILVHYSIKIFQIKTGKIMSNVHIFYAQR